MLNKMNDRKLQDEKLSQSFFVIQEIIKWQLVKKQIYSNELFMLQKRSHSDKMWLLNSQEQECQHKSREFVMINIDKKQVPLNEEEAGNEYS